MTFPDGEIFGVDRYVYDSPSGLVAGMWNCKFEELSTGQWRCVYVDQTDEETELFSVGDSAREAFEMLVNKFVVLNGGYTPTLGANIHNMRARLDEAGVV